MVFEVADRCKLGFWFHNGVMQILISPLRQLCCSFYCTVCVVIWLSMLAVFGSLPGKQQNICIYLQYCVFFTEGITHSVLPTSSFSKIVML